MRGRELKLVLAGLVASGCVLPDVEFDPNIGKAAAGTGGGAGAGGGAGSGGTAGKGGGGASGAGGVDLGTQIELDCGTYCDRYFMACTGHVANTYDDKSDCFLTCTSSGWPLKDPNMLNAPGTIECRAHHADLANTMGPDPHCFHSAEVPSMGACH
jgi:hypothetical protein